MRRRWRSALAAVGVAVVAACGGGGNSADDTLRLYTSVTQDTVDAVVAGFGDANPNASVDVFRAPTGELAARIAAELRTGGLQADVLWLSDPLSIQQYARDGLLRSWTPRNVDAVPPEYRTESFFGTRLLNMVIVASPDVDPLPMDWGDLPTVDGVVVIPDPGFAGSAFGALGFMALDPQYGIEWYRALHDSGAVEVGAPGEVVAGVAEGRYAAGMSLDNTVRAAVEDGSPVVLVWPASGAISIYSPIAVVDASESSGAEPFVEYVLTTEAQAAIAATGWQPIRGDVPWPETGPQQGPDWTQAFDRQDELLAAYRAVFRR